MTTANLVVFNLNIDDFKNIVSSAIAEELEKNSYHQKDPFSDYPDFLTRSEVCKILQIAKATLNNWCNDGRLNPTKQGKVIRFHKSEIIDLFRCSPKYKRY